MLRNLLLAFVLMAFTSPCNGPLPSGLRVEKTETDSLGYFGYVYQDSSLVAIGEYADSSRTIPDGQFVFLYPNGKIAAKGEFVMGLKDGEWERFDSTGKQMAIKIYDADAVRKWQ